MDFLRKYTGYIIALCAIGFFVYLFNIRNPLFWDDADWILNNPTVHSLSWENIKFIFSHDALSGIGLTSNYYRPFLFLTFLFNYIVSGPDPVLYHLFSNSVHILNSICIFYLVYRWFQRIRVAFLSSLLFLVHPLQTEAVTYISGRGDPLSAFFMLSGIISHLHFRDSNKKIKAYLLPSILMILGLLSRETAILFPAYLAAALMAFEYKDKFLRRLKKTAISILPFLALGTVYMLLRVTVLNFQNTLNFYNQSNLYTENILYRLYTFFHALTIYLRITFWPTGLHMERDIPVSTSLLAQNSWLGFLLLATLFIWLIYSYRTRLSHFWVCLFGTSVFLINLIPTSGIIPINALIYEHWLYFSLFGFFVIVAWYFDKLLRYLEVKKRNLKIVLVFLLIIYSFFLSIQSIRRNLIWGDTEEFYKEILSYHPKNVRILNNLGNLYSDRGDLVNAAPLYERAIEADPYQAAPYYNLGNIARDLGDFANAEKLYKKSIEINPSFHYAYRNLAALYIQQKKIPEAISVLEKLQEIMPSPALEEVINELRD